MVTALAFDQCRLVRPGCRKYFKIVRVLCSHSLHFSKSLIIHQEKTKKITTMTVVSICDRNKHKMLPTLALNFFKNY